MWKQINAARDVFRRHLRAILATAALVLAIPMPGHAAVEYEKICSVYGANFFYIPGTDTCVNAGQTVQSQFDLARQITRAATGTAMATSLVNPFLPDGTNYAISTHWAVFDGQHAAGVVGMIRIQGNLSLTMGIAFGLDRGSLTSTSNRTATEFGVRFRRSRGATCAPLDAWGSSIPGSRRRTRRRRSDDLHDVRAAQML
ncbi:porin [Bradyrhizobium sp. S3.5.5]|uniref:porin n=1 Tax=Bradyrhizobium sp. S3.5.5 TaxID=3156430 RepID=UPI003392325E